MKVSTQNEAIERRFRVEALFDWDAAHGWRLRELHIFPPVGDEVETILKWQRPTPLPFPPFLNTWEGWIRLHDYFSRLDSASLHSRWARKKLNRHE